ncbi:MAG TPA: type III-B CRISPR-associated protein Cas10/Cmr2, partial [Candidatus Cloacimonadota bacterium]|nr:type III-B CRISPR-associated protein Cas10/Cmr2 [Candidatus Cloacimonadota bacterium]
MADYLMLFSISHVQSFISNSRKTQDLFNGSKIFSDMTKSQLELLQNETSTEVIFPAKTDKFMPNRLLIKVNNMDDSYIFELADKLMKNFQSQLLKLSFQTVDKSDPILRAQIQDYFKPHWSAVEMNESYEIAYNELERKHAGSKNLRMFEQLGKGAGEQGRKCSLCGEYNALIYNDASKEKAEFISDEAISIKSNLIKATESICAVCALKRLNKSPAFPSTAELAMKEILSDEELRQLNELNIDPEILYQENDVSKYLESDDNEEVAEKVEKLKIQIRTRCQMLGKTLPKYYALIMYDGDNMGKLLSGAELKEDTNLRYFHQELTKAPSENAKVSSKIVDQAGKTIYAGGDDFLGFCTLEKLLPTLKKLSATFDQQVKQKLGHLLKLSSEITMSAGVVIAHYKTPLHIVLNWARKMEKESK